MNKYKFLLGTDPEFGILNKATGFAYPPIALMKFNGVETEFNEEKPEHYIFSKIESPKTVLHMDGSALELEVEPSDNPKNLWKNIQVGIKLINDLLTPFNDVLELSSLPTLDWDIQTYTMENVGRTFIHLTRFGCDADYDAFLKNSREPQQEENAEKHPYRYFGGHIHLGIDDKDLLYKAHQYPDVFTKMCAVFFGNLCTANTINDREEKLRLYRYGKPGRYRIQKHGIEYRSPSNSWVTNYPVIEQLFVSAEHILNAFDNEEIGMKVLKLAEETHDSIVRFDKTSCGQLFQEAMSYAFS